MIQRKEYIERLESLREKQVIKVVTGVRRCGKSTLFSLYIDRLKQTGVTDNQIVSINLEDLAYESLLDYKELYKYVESRLCKDKFTYVFLDEVQNCAGFEKAVDSLFIRDNVDVYITGSNAYMLSGELATLLSGRYVTIDMLPLSFAEYLQYFGPGADARAKFNDYLHIGSFPYAAALEKAGAPVTQYLDGVYNTILVKDVSRRQKLSDVAMLENIVRILTDSIGSPVSARNIAGAAVSAGRKISANTVENYIRALTDSFLFYRADRYDVKGKKRLQTLGKYYIVDPGIRALLTPGSSPDLGHLLENIVFLELKRRGCKVCTGKILDDEIDFVAIDKNEINYYQVCASVLAPATLQRELRPLRQVRDNHPKTLLTLDEIGAEANYDGIRQLNAIDWLLSR